MFRRRNTPTRAVIGSLAVNHTMIFVGAAPVVPTADHDAEAWLEFLARQTWSAEGPWWPHRPAPLPAPTSALEARHAARTAAWRASRFEVRETA